MLYLVKSYTEEGPILKIGYAKDIDSRTVQYKTHNPGGRYTEKYLKEKLGDIYSSAYFQGTVKASDLEKWFDGREIRMTVDGKKVPGFEILKKK